MFEKDISHLSKPEIKGRGFLGSGKEIIETQTYFTQPEKDWEFDDTQLLTYNNPVYKDQCKLKGIKIDESGFIPQKPLDQVEDTEEEQTEEEENEEEENFDVDETPKSVSIKKFNRPSDKPDAPMPRMRPPKEDAPAPRMRPSSEEKAEEKKAEESKVDEPKTEEPKTEEPKTEEPKAETTEKHSFSNADVLNRLTKPKTEEVETTEEPKANMTELPNKAIDDTMASLEAKNKPVRDLLNSEISVVNLPNTAPSIKLNIDKTAIDKLEIKGSQNKLKIKLNVKPKV